MHWYLKKTTTIPYPNRRAFRNHAKLHWEPKRASIHDRLDASAHKTMQRRRRIQSNQQDVDGAIDLDLGGRTLRIESWPTAHTNTDVTVRDLATDTWFLGDLLFVVHHALLLQYCYNLLQRRSLPGINSSRPSIEKIYAPLKPEKIVVS